MPSAHELPDVLAPLARRNAFELHETSWGNDVQRLITTLEVAVGDRQPQKNPPTRQPTRERETTEFSPTLAKWVAIAVVLTAVIGFVLGLSGVLASP